MSIERINNGESNQALIEKLRAIIEFESSKPISEQDVDLIDECVDYLMELENGIELTDEELENGKKQIYMLLDKKKKPQKKLRFKGLLIAACLAILMLLANFVALACGVDTISILKEWGNSIVEMIQGERVEHNDISIIKDEKKMFSSIEELGNSVDFNFLYPTLLPEDINITLITLGGSYDENINFDSNYKTIAFVTSDPSVSVKIHTNPEYLNNYINGTDLTSQQICGYICYLIVEENFVQCSFEHNSISYVVNTRNTEELFVILNNLKEKE